MVKAAVIVVDMLNGFFDQDGLKERRAALANSINDLLGAARRDGWPVIWIRQAFKADLSDAFLIMKRNNVSKFIEGTSDTEVIPELDRRSGDVEVIKKRYSPFFRTDLENILVDLNPGVVIVAGINTHACVRMTAIDAYQREHQVIVARNCVGSWNQEHHDVTLRYLDDRIAAVLTNDEILDRLAAEPES